MNQIFSPARSFCLVLLAATFLQVDARADLLALSEGQVAPMGSATAVLANGAIDLDLDDPKNDSGVSISPGPDQVWDFSKWKYLEMEVENLSAESQMRLSLQVDSVPEGKKGHETRIGIALNPGEKRTWRMRLPHRWMGSPSDELPGVKTIDTSKVKVIKVYMRWPFENARSGLVNARLSNLRVEGAVTPTEVKTKEQYVPFIDVYGQYIHADWPTKVRSSEEIKRQHLTEMEELAQSSRPGEWNRYGGWANGPQLDATGNFRVEKIDGKWWMVDPEGRLFFSQGIDVISRYNDPLTVMPGRESWFNFSLAGQTKYFPTDGILKVKYDTEEYRPAYFQTVAKRLEHWGINTIGNWSNADIMLLGKMPYTLQLTDFNSKLPSLQAQKLKMYDVFDPAYAARMKTLIADQATEGSIIKKSLTDPMCIGYFIDNELNFGNRKENAYVNAVLKSPATQAAKKEFVSDLRKKYGEIAKLNSAWETQYGSWNDLLKSDKLPQGNGYGPDGEVFFEKSVERYFRLCRESIKSVAPHRLYLGCRFVGTDAVRRVLYEMSKKYCDVLTVNIYSFSTANFPVDNYPDMPVLIGEFHFGVIDRGMLSPSLCHAGVTQEDRSLAYTRFVQGALVHPNIVGTHWFQYRDQPLTGRGDGEAYQLGFVDVTDVPYRELCEAAREVGEHMYSYRMAGKLANSMKGE